MKVSEQVFIVEIVSTYSQREGPTGHKILKCPYKCTQTSSGNNHYQSLHSYIGDIIKSYELLCTEQTLTEWFL